MIPACPTTRHQRLASAERRRTADREETEEVPGHETEARDESPILLCRDLHSVNLPILSTPFHIPGWEERMT